MNDISKEIFEKYQVRKTKKQKDDFISFIKEKFPEATVEKSGMLGSRNIVIGDVENAKAVLGAHYDTCAKMPFPNFLAPKNMVAYILFVLLIVLGAYIVTRAVNLCVYSITRNWLFALLMSEVVLLTLGLLMIIGPENNHTANDNTSGIITLLEIYGSLTPEQREKFAFVLFDNEEIGLFGSSAFAKKHKNAMKDKLLFNFDCVSDGDYIMFIHNKKARNKYGEIFERTFSGTEDKTVLVEKSSGVFYPSDQLNFPCYVAVAAFKRNKIIGLYVDKIHTKHDVNFDERNIELIKKDVLECLYSV